MKGKGWASLEDVIEIRIAIERKKDGRIRKG